MRALKYAFDEALASLWRGRPSGLLSTMTIALAHKLNESGGDIASTPMTPDRLAGLIALIETGAISGPIGKEVFAKMFTSGRSAAEIVGAEGLTQIDDESAILAMIDDVLAQNADAVSQHRAGKTATFGFLVGQVMKAAAGKANPKRVNELLRRRLDPPEP